MNANSEVYGSLIGLKPEFEERYIILHKHTFPEVLDRIYKSNIRNYTIFLKDGILFSFLEYIGNNYEADMEKIGQDKVTREWWKLTDPMQKPLETRNEGEWWASIEKIIFNNKKKVKSGEAKNYAFMTKIRPGKEQAVRDCYKTFPDEFWIRLEEVNIQNYFVFLKDTSLYLYFEHFGNNIKTDLDKLKEFQETKVWKKSLSPLLEKTSDKGSFLYWSAVKEVFHTD